MQIEEAYNDSNSLFSASIIAPLAKRQTTSKIYSKNNFSLQEKIEDIGFQIVDQLSIITPLEVNPKDLCEGISTYKYQRKSPSIMEAEFYKKQTKERADFIMAITSLFKKSFTSQLNKFSILMPSGGLIYFLYEQTFASPKLFISMNSKEMTDELTKQDIKFRELPQQQYQKQRFIVENNQIKIFFGFFVNWVIQKKMSIDIYANYTFELCLKDSPLIMKVGQQRATYEHLMLKEQSCIGQKTNKLHMLRYDGIWYKQDILKIEQKLSKLQIQNNKNRKNAKINHDYEFKILKYSLDLTQFNLQCSQAND